MTFLRQYQYKIKKVPAIGTVPNNDIARLMYYLNCACHTVEYNDRNISRYRNYNNWSLLSDEEIRLLITLCYIFSPELFNNKVFFQSDDDQSLAVQSIVVAGRICRVYRKMTYNKSWIEDNYFNPIRNLDQRLNNQSQMHAYKNEFSGI
jgi:hypothetical protein